MTMKPVKSAITLLLLILLFSAAAGATHASGAHASDTPTPKIVAVAGTFQAQLGCPGDWNTDCENTYLIYDPVDDLWRATFDLKAGDYEYKVALNGTWEENYGRFAESYGENILLTVAEDGPVTFFYSHNSHWITDSVNSIIANVSGSFQDKIGCPETWQPDCLRSWLEDPDEDGIYTYITTYVSAGEYEAKVAVNESWDVNFGADGAPGGDNIPFTVPEGAQVTFTWDSDTKLLTIATADAPEGALTTPPVVAVPNAIVVNPDFVTIPGTIQSQLGCPGDWQPDCAATFLTLDEEDAVWQGEFDLPAGDYEYKAAINQSWDENYGLNATKDGPNIPLSLTAAQTVKFYYDHRTHWVTDNVNDAIVTLSADFQQAIGCAADNDPACLRTWLQDPDGDGVASLLVTAVPAGDYTVQTFLNEADPTGDPQTFTAPENAELYFEYDLENELLTISTEGEPSGNLGQSQAHWVSRDTIAWDVDTDTAVTYFLNVAPEGGLKITTRGLANGETLASHPRPRRP
jgi:pullulanase